MKSKLPIKDPRSVWAAGGRVTYIYNPYIENIILFSVVVVCVFPVDMHVRKGHSPIMKFAALSLLSSKVPITSREEKTNKKPMDK